MSNASHTPGPWHVVATDDGEFHALDKRGHWIAEEIDEEADARLIAAAPDLLAACINAAPMLAELGKRDDAVWATYSQVLNAIAKTEGR